MSKAVLVKDMPESCNKCDYSKKGWSEDEDVYGLMCTETYDMMIDCFYNERSGWCPFRPLPEQRSTMNIEELKREAEANGISYQQQIIFNIGWNDCLDAITGERKENKE